jgi:hypothetical protein
MSQQSHTPNITVQISQLIHIPNATAATTNVITEPCTPLLNAAAEPHPKCHLASLTPNVTLEPQPHPNVIATYVG